ncbi:3432_t:CDS:2, partial [Racocetra fulgida]
LLDANYSQFYKNKINKQKRQVHSLDVENESVKKHSRVEHAYEMEVTENICEIGIQTNEIGVQVDKKTREIAQLNTKINEIENLQKQLEYAYDYVIKSVYNEIESLIFNKKRFSLDSLLNFTPENWLANRNPVIVNFINTLTHNDNNDHTNYTSNEKTFKRM